MRPAEVPNPADVPRLLAALGQGDEAALDILLPIVYDELKRIARHHLRGSGEATLCTTELVHEAFLRLARGAQVDWEGRAHFFGAASRAMRQVLVDFARRRRAAKRGGNWSRTALVDGHGALEVQLDEMIALDAALDLLDQVDARLRQVVEMRFFAGLTEHEIARILGVSERTVERDWLKARMFLLRGLSDAERPMEGA